MPELYAYHDLPRLIFEQPPLLMLDRIAVDADAGSAEGVKAVSMNEDYFQGHFPGAPVMPAVLQTAAVCQLGAVLMRNRTGDRDAVYLLAELSRLKFRSPVRPGDLLAASIALDADEQTDRPVFKAKVRVGNTVTCEGRVTLQRHAPEDLLHTPGRLDAPLHPALEAAAETPPPLDISGIMEAIPHRYPFLLIDRVLELDRDNSRIVVLKNVTGQESFFRGLPIPVLPAYIQAEIGAQAGCALALSLPENADKLAYFMSLDTAQFLSPVVPGDQLVVEVEVAGRGRFGRGTGTMHVGNRLVSELSLKFAVLERQET